MPDQSALHPDTRQDFSQSEKTWSYLLQPTESAAHPAARSGDLDFLLFVEKGQYMAMLRSWEEPGRRAFSSPESATKAEDGLLRILLRRYSDSTNGHPPDSHWRCPPSDLPLNRKIRLPTERIRSKLLDLQSTTDTTAVQALRRQIAMQEMLLLLLETAEQPQMISTPAEDEAELAVRKSIDYVHLHYQEPLTVGELLRRSGLRRWQYSIWFRRLTGQAPLDYLNELRLKQARERLSLTDDPLREIARSVGFRDEYYFSRRFSQFMGVPPTEYRHLARRRVESVRRVGPRAPQQPKRIAVSDGIVGDLLPLGLRPLAAPLGIVRSQVGFADELDGIIDLGAVLSEERLAPLEPDLILCESADDALLERIGERCAAVSIERFVPPDERLRIIGELTGRTHEAAAWIASHDEALRSAWDAAGVRAGETAAAFILLGTRLYVMAGQGLAATLYRTGGFLPCPKIARMIAAGVGFRRVLPEELGEYAADRFLLMGGSDAAARLETRLLMQTGLLHRHAAQLHLLSGHWNFDDAWTRHHLIAALPALLRESVPLSALEEDAASMP
ncbi:hypothetical protein B9G55_06990 [Saccharibacillus sp. O16]|nr:hypothetical protein B9G55_06990 [Saccharibacillus sp. O16]